MTRVRLLPLALALLGSCAAPSADIMPRYGTLDIGGDFGLKGSSSPGAVPKSNASAAGFSRDESVIGLRADVDLGTPHLMVSTQSSSHDGSGALDVDMTNGNGVTIFQGEQIDSRMDFGLHQTILTYDFLPSDMFEAGIGLGLSVVDVETSVTASANRTFDMNETIPMPVLAVRGGVAVGDFEAQGLLSGISLDAGSDSVSLMDLDLFVRYRLFGLNDRLAGSIALGYRQVAFGVDYDDGDDIVEIDLTFDGPYLALIFSL